MFNFLIHIRIFSTLQNFFPMSLWQIHEVCVCFLLLKFSAQFICVCTHWHTSYIDDTHHDMKKKCSIGTLSKKNYGIIWEFFPYRGGEGLPNSQNFCKLTKCFFACQISLISGGKTEFWEFLGGGSPIPKSKCNKNGKILTFWWKPKMFLRV